MNKILTFFHIDIAQNLCCESDTRTSEFDREVRFLLDKGVFDVSSSREMAVLPEAPPLLKSSRGGFHFMNLMKKLFLAGACASALILTGCGDTESFVFTNPAEA